MSVEARAGTVRPHNDSDSRDEFFTKIWDYLKTLLQKIKTKFTPKANKLASEKPAETKNQFCKNAKASTLSICFEMNPTLISPFQIRKLAYKKYSVPYAVISVYIESLIASIGYTSQGAITHLYQSKNQELMKIFEKCGKRKTNSRLFTLNSLQLRASQRV